MSLASNMEEISIELGSDHDSLYDDSLFEEADDDDDDFVFSSKSVPLVKELMKRLLKVYSSLKEKSTVVENEMAGATSSTNEEEAAPTPALTSSAIAERENALLSLLELQELYGFLWARLLCVLDEENERCSDSYMATLNMQDRVPFESLANAIHHNTVFCDHMGEVLGLNYEQQLNREEARNAVGRDLILEFYTRMERTQRTASHCALLVVEGSRESFLDPISMYDLCKVLATEKNPRKRLVPLSLMFSMLDQDEQTVSEALAQNMPKVLLQRFRHWVHQLYGYFPLHRETTLTSRSQRRSPQRYRSAAVPSDMDSHPTSRRSSPGRSPIFTQQQVQEVAIDEASEASPVVKTAPDSPLPRSAEPTFTAEASPPEPTGNGVRKRQRLDRSVTPQDTKNARHEGPAEVELYLDGWIPKAGDRVGRGPGWKSGQQGKGCDYGVVEGCTENEVLVRWVPSLDQPAAGEQDRLFLYQFGSPHYEVVSWETYLRVKTLNVTRADIRMLELLQIGIVAGILCQQNDAILPVLQFQTIESALKVLDSIDIRARFLENEQAREAAERSVRQTLAEHNTNEATEEEMVRSLLQWDVNLISMKRCYRLEREMLARIGWVLSAILSHKKLAFLFLDADGVSRILRLVQGKLDVYTTYGCAIVLSHLAKTAVFEELLRRQRSYFEPIMQFIIDQWKHTTNSDVQSSVGAFLFHSLSFPIVIDYFEAENGPMESIEALERCLKISEGQFDVMHSDLLLALLRCLNIYLVTHLMLSTKVIFRKHRVLSALVTQSSRITSLPRDPPTVDAILGFLAAPSPGLPGVSAENVQSLLTAERLGAIQKLVDKGMHTLLLRCANFFFVQSRWDLLIASLQALCALTVIPYVRPLIAEVRSHESGIAQLLAIVNDLAVSYQNRNTSREGHLLPCVVAALQILIHITNPPADVADESAVANFNNACGAFRASDGVRALLEVLKIRKDASMSAKLNYFPVVARAVQLMAVLRRYSDTAALFEALNIRTLAQDLSAQYSDVQREFISVVGARKLPTELGPAGHFMDNLKSFMPSAFGGVSQADVVKVHAVDPLEMEQRQAIIGRAVVDYSKESLLQLIAEHLDSEGLSAAAAALRSESGIKSSTATGASYSDGVTATSMSISDAAAKGPTPSLDGVIRSYLRQQQERCPNPIETLPRFDLTKKHVYLPLPIPLDDTRNEFNRLLWRRCGGKFTLRTQTNANWLTYRYPAFMFDITGSGEELQGESVAFCDGGDSIMIGTSEGSIALFDTFPEETPDEKLLEQHLVFENEAISALVVSDDGSLIAAVNDSHKAHVMRRNLLPVAQQELTECRTLRFSRDNRLAVVTSEEEHACRVHDLVTGVELRTLSDPIWTGENMANVALFDCTSQLVLNDAILWDLRAPEKPMFRFDRITESFASVFHPKLPLVIIDEKVWDMRTWRMMQTVPSFQKTTSFHCSKAGRVLYSFREASRISGTHLPIVAAVDSYTLDSVFSEEVRPSFKSFAVDPSDRYCAAILDQDIDSVIRLFSLSAGPYPDHGAFASPAVQEEQDSAMDADEEEMEQWSIEDDDYDTDDSTDSNDDEFEEDEDDDDDSYDDEDAEEEFEEWEEEDEEESSPGTGSGSDEQEGTQASSRHAS
ncbi:hypothetical protein conserved [Leishmania donovani]|uniref:Hypothetical_protein_conserved n=1 Tax=Leishmania donovani TaxID=5661 RepID=A0A6J8FKQ6_LEIDO|nr:hypothetical protein conserved [Leishmania donovani]VDZ48006.1 hypothetical_protein_conserved [Leishmania donovani]